jgi:hypothetical protein
MEFSFVIACGVANAKKGGCLFQKEVQEDALLLQVEGLQLVDYFGQLSSSPQLNFSL